MSQLIDDAVQRAVQEAVLAERRRLRAVIAHQMDTVVENYRSGMDDTARKRAFALGAMGALHGVSTQLGEEIVPVYAHIATGWQDACERLGV